jgi:2'-5' RNA ligase
VFCALRLRPETLTAVERWQLEALHGGRLVTREHLHLTLAFLGATPRTLLGEIADSLGRLAAASGPVELTLERYRETGSVGMLTFHDVEGNATALAEGLRAALAPLGLPRRQERRPWLPHLTVLRFSTRPQLRPALPALGPISPSDTAVYSSILRSDGARYEVLEARPLGG